MKNSLLFLFSVVCLSELSAQQDSITVQAKLSEDNQYLTVQQEILYHNPLDKEVSQIKLLNWISAYKNRQTPLLKRKLEDRKKDLYFAAPSELGNLESLQISVENVQTENLDLNKENLYIFLPKSLKKNETAKINLQYTLRLPKNSFTSYGTSAEKTSLKYFFIVPDSFENEEQKPKYYLDIEEVQNTKTHWKFIFDIPAGQFSKSNLPEVFPNYFEGDLKSDPEFLISKTEFPRSSFPIDGKNVIVDFGYPLLENEKADLEFYLPLHLSYLKSATGIVPSKIFISDKFKNDEDFIGNNDIKFWKFRYKLFSDAENIDMDYFGIIAKNILNQSLSYDKNTDHWLINGLKSYLEAQYLAKFYSDKKLLGDLPDQVKIFGLKPLKAFYASKLKLTERYGLAYQYIETENFDQSIDIPFSKLSNFNKTAISSFEMGSLFHFVAEKMGTKNFETFLKEYISETENSEVDPKIFLDKLAIASQYSSEFIDTLIKRKQRVNFSLKSYKRKDNNFQIKIAKNTPEKIPFKIETEEESGETKSFWFDTNDSKKSVVYTVPNTDAHKILVNNDYSFPESNYRDNYLYTKGLFSNTKKIKIKIFRDIPNPEYNEIYLNPKVNFNAYDKFMVGMNFRNTSLFRRKFAYSFTPYYSTGTNQITGSAGTSYTFMPAESFFRFLQIGASASYYHYDFDLSYTRLSASANINFTKNPRSDINRSLSFGYSYFEKDLSPERILKNEYGKYNLWNLNYNYIDQRLIHESYIGGGLQWMEDFQKISAEAFYRYEYAKNKKISFRMFAGAFITNTTKNDVFDFGISRVSNYSFSYGLIGQSATSGILSQQMIIADGGFKSYVAPLSNQWITSVNIDSNIWKWFNIYADAGMYKNKNQSAEFIWDSGIKFAILPDFLEIYFPLQSSLGFEPSFKDYGSRIRFTLNLNFGAITSYFRRGVF